jgi:hypothetical protein
MWTRVVCQLFGGRDLGMNDILTSEVIWLEVFLLAQRKALPRPPVGDRDRVFNPHATKLFFDFPFPRTTRAVGLDISNHLVALEVR